jgi:hypothetical protein
VARVRIQIKPEAVEPIEQPEPVQFDPQHTERPNSLHQETAVTMPTQGIFISRRKAVWTAIIALLTVGLITAYVNRERPVLPAATLGTSQELPGATTEAQQYYNEISPYVELPSGEAPTVLNVSDAEAVKKDNAALTDIKNGDKMLFFTKSRKLVVYRPSTKKVVAVVSLATSTPTPGAPR